MEKKGVAAPVRAKLRRSDAPSALIEPFHWNVGSDE
jgi:hypothetical protein